MVADILFALMYPYYFQKALGNNTTPSQDVKSKLSSFGQRTCLSLISLPTQTVQRLPTKTSLATVITSKWVLIRSHWDSYEPWLGLHPSPKVHIRQQIQTHPLPGTLTARAFGSNRFYDFRYDDEDTVMNEIDEFYSYVEMPQVAENLKAWIGSFPGGEYPSLR